MARGTPSSAAPLGIMGGTFDPIHLGHLRTALEMQAAAGLARVYFVPAAVPPHREPAIAPAELRQRMLEAALAGQAGFLLDDRELRRAGPSYTVDTLVSLRSERPAQPLCLILGTDAFLGLPGWHEWQRLLTLAHILVARRPGWEVPRSGLIGTLLDERRVRDAAALREAPCGHVLVQTVTQLEISASAIRALVAQGGDPRFLVTDAVRRIILESGCYAGRPGEVAELA